MGKGWKDVTIGFTVAGIIAAFVPRVFFETLFVGSTAESPAFWQVVLQTWIGPIAAFFTFIGSMGNIPLAAVLYSNGVSFAGVMAFIFSDLVVFPVLRIQAKYYGWKMAFYILAVFLVSLVIAALLMHYGFALTGMLPEAATGKTVTQRDFFQIDYTLFLNLGFLVITAVFFWWKHKASKDKHGKDGETQWSDRILFWVAIAAIAWLVGGLLAALIR